MLIKPTPEFWKVFKETNGALSCTEAVAIMNIALQVPDGGEYIECGSHAGKSGMSAAYGLPSGKFYMVDPIFDLKNIEAWEHTIQGHPDNLAWGYAKDENFKKDIEKKILFASNNMVEPILCGSYSEKEIPKHDKYSYAFIDSDNHQPKRVHAELELLKPRMISGGIIAFHDFNNQYIAPQEAHRMLVDSGEYDNVNIDWNLIFDYVRENNLEEGNISWHNRGSMEFPCFVGAVKRK